MRLTKWSLIALIALSPMMFVPSTASAHGRRHANSQVQGTKKGHGHGHHHGHHHHKNAKPNA